MNASLRIVVAGLGTVGGGTVKILLQQAALLEMRCGRKLELVAVSARDKKKARGIDFKGIEWVDDPLTLPGRKDIDVIVEMIGGSEGVARTLVEKALISGKHVVTANKALIAHHGKALARLAEKSGKVLAYEAAVAGGIPIIQTLREGLAANAFIRIAGILNGTCNFILTSMWQSKSDFALALAEAQRIGYAEADPTFDIDGLDSGHKLALMTSLAYGCAPAPDAMHVEGIRGITLHDLTFADELGYAIKLLGITSQGEEGLLQRVHPCMVPKSSAIGQVDGAYNAIIVEGDAVGRVILEGKGAGESATASSVVGDIIDIARGANYKPFTVAVDALQNMAFASMDSLKTSYYVRLSLLDKPGVLASVTGILRDAGISLRSFLQHGNAPLERVQVVLTTHETLELSMRKALESVAALEFVLEPPHMIRIESL